jgi:pentose-5-phosphate-3-epimerase
VKISASIFAQNTLDFNVITNEMRKIGVEYLHIDCQYPEDIIAFLEKCGHFASIPFDFHLIYPSDSLLEALEFVEKGKFNRICLQFENFDTIPQLFFKSSIKKGLALKTVTAIEAIEKNILDQIDFLMLMCTEPGVSGGQFDKHNFSKIHQLKAVSKQLKITVDGGVNDEIAYILRLLDVDTIVLGSYLMKDENFGLNLLHLMRSSPGNTFKVKDFMQPISEDWLVEETNIDFKLIVEKIHQSGIGMSFVVDNDGKLSAIATNADIRKGILSNWGDLNNIHKTTYLNYAPIVINENLSTYEMLKTINHFDRVILFLPVVDDSKKLIGLLPLQNLTKTI